MILDFLKGDGDYELVKDVIFDDYLWTRIKKVFSLSSHPITILSKQPLKPFGLASADTCAKLGLQIVLQTEDELLAEKKCVAHLTGEVPFLAF